MPGGTADYIEGLLAATKFISILLAGIFGILALLVDYRDTKTGTITVWGKRAVIGVLAATFIGAVSQGLENTISNINSRNSELRYENTVLQLSRLLLPLQPRRIDTHYRLLVDIPPNSHDSFIWRGKEVRIPDLLQFVAISVHLNDRPLTYNKLLEFDGSRSDYSFLARSRSPGNIQRSVSGEPSFGALFYVSSEEIWTDSDRMRSIPDLAGAQMIVSLIVQGSRIDYPENFLQSLIDEGLSLESMILRFGELQVDVPLSGMKDVSLKRPGSSYVYQFPDSIDDIWGLSE